VARFVAQIRQDAALIEAHYHWGKIGGIKMVRVLSSLAIAAALLGAAPSEASAWVCRATGVASGGWGHSYSIIDAKLIALRKCERRSPVPICTLIGCVPG
jgi:hypothetical protein